MSRSGIGAWLGFAEVTTKLVLAKGSVSFRGVDEIVYVCFACNVHRSRVQTPNLFAISYAKKRAGRRSCKFWWVLTRVLVDEAIS